jgi:CheY-like chemotaxis protein
MLAYSGKSRFEPLPLNLNEIVEDMGHLLSVSISKKAEVRYALTRDLPPVMGDPTQIRQVIMNLITNASDALGDQSGVISVSTGTKHCTAEELGETLLDVEYQSGLYAFLEVSDTGGGMEEETLERIYDPFFTTKFTGRGLGLATVRGIVRTHGGAIKVWSEKGEGTTFRVFLPITQAQDPREAAERIMPVGDTEFAGTVLFVDDEASLRSLGKMVLEHAGMDVLLATDGSEAVEVFREHSEEIAAVVMDLTMPEMGGEEAWREMRRLGARVPVIFSSGYLESVASDDLMASGNVGFLKKPYRPKVLLDKLHEMLRPGDSGEEDLP